MGMQKKKLWELALPLGWLLRAAMMYPGNKYNRRVLGTCLGHWGGGEGNKVSARKKNPPLHVQASRAPAWPPEEHARYIAHWVQAQTGGQIRGSKTDNCNAEWGFLKGWGALTSCQVQWSRLLLMRWQGPEVPNQPAVSHPELYRVVGGEANSTPSLSHGQLRAFWKADSKVEPEWIMGLKIRPRSRNIPHREMDLGRDETLGKGKAALLLQADAGPRGRKGSGAKRALHRTPTFLLRC